jgi:SAM-dependent methyltransferase
VSRQNLIGATNVSFHNAVVGDLPVADASLDFAYSLGVLHHVPDTLKEIKSIGIKLKPGAPFLVYLYYAFDNRPAWFKLLWRLSDVFRLAISRLPATLRYWTCDLIAAMVYWPLARIALFLDHFGVMPQSWPLAAYRSRSFYVLRTDALDRFGTRLEQRFTKAEITDMLTEAGFSNIEFSNSPPFWTAVASKR